MSTAQQTGEPDPSEDGVLYEDQVAPEYGILGLTLRELLIVGAWLLAFVLSFFPVFLTGPSIWGLGLEWVLPIGVPTVATFLIVLRRFSPDGIRRVGSLGIDQFASVAFSVAAVYWAQQVWSGTAATVASGVYLLGWVPILQLLLALALVTFTVFAPLVPGLREDFHGRMETLAHRNANPVRPVIARPRPGAPVVSTPADENDDSDAGSDAAPAEAAPAGAVSDASPTGEDVTAPDTNGPAASATGADGDDDATHVFESPIGPPQITIASHAAGGDTGTSVDVTESDYVPGYARRSRRREATGEVDIVRDEDAQEPEAHDSVASDVSASDISASDTGAHEFGALEDVLDLTPESTDTTRASADAPASTHDDVSIDSESPAASADSAMPNDGESNDTAGGDDRASDDRDDSPLFGSMAETIVIRDDDADDTSWDETDDSDRDESRNAGQPFWILAGSERDVHDEHGEPVFRIGPTAWTLVIEDRDGAYVVRHDDGRIGYLHDISNITKG